MVGPRHSPGSAPARPLDLAARRLAPALIGAALALPGAVTASPAPAPGASAQASVPRLLLLAAPGDAPTLITQIHRALVTELRDLPAAVIIAVDDRPQAPLPERILIGAAAARRSASVAAVWLDVDGDDLVLGFLDPRTEEVRLRRISGGRGRDATNLETAALIARESLAAMLQRPAVSPAAPPPATRPAPPPRPRHVRLLIGYHGELFPDRAYVERARRWQSGVDLQLAYLWRSGAYAGAASMIPGPLSLPAIPLADGKFIDAKIQRVPLHAVAGYHRPLGRFGIEAELGAGVDVVLARSALCDPDTQGCTTADETADLTVVEPRIVTYGFAPRVRALVSPVPDFFLFAGGGVDLYNDADFYYEYRCSRCARRLFSARIVRPVVQVGLLLRL